MRLWKLLLFGVAVFALLLHALDTYLLRPLGLKLELLQLLLLFLAFSAAITFFIKRHTRQQTFVVGTLARTQKPLPWFDRLAKLGKPLEKFAEAGLVLGFGVFAVDFLFGRASKHRLPLLAASFAGLALLFLGIDVFLGNFVSASPLFKEFYPVFTAGFALLGFAGFTLVALLAQAWNIGGKLLAGVEACPGVAPLIPGIELPNVPIVVPWHGWLSLFFILVIHEGMHGILARHEKIRVKSAGVLFLGFLPIGAFVEPDEKQLKRAKDLAALRLYAAGPTANLAALPLITLFVLLVAGLLGVTAGPWAQGIHRASVEGVYVSGVHEDYSFCGDTFESPAYGVFEEGMRVNAMNGKPVAVASDISLELAAKRFEPAAFTVTTTMGEQKTFSLKPNAFGAFGIQLQEKERPGYEKPAAYALYRETVGGFFSFLNWFFLLNLLVALFNFLPLGMVDGGRIARILFRDYFAFTGLPNEAIEKLVSRAFLVPIVLLMLVNALPLFL